MVSHSFKGWERWVVFGFGMLAVSGSLLGYAGLGGRLWGEPYKGLKEELHILVDALQLWYYRPASQGGGEESFLHLDLSLLKLPGQAERYRWITPHGTFEVIQREDEFVDLLITSTDGRQFSIPRITSQVFPLLP